ncbi:MAG: hypothetical protein R2912_00335 [Eubacteriales bacterium]
MKQMQNGATSPEQTAKAAGNMPNQPMGREKPFSNATARSSCNRGCGHGARTAGVANLLSTTIDSFKEMLSVLPPIFILLGLLDVWVDPLTMIKYTGKGSGFKGVLIAFLLGSAAAGPHCAAFSVCGCDDQKGHELYQCADLHRRMVDDQDSDTCV